MGGKASTLAATARARSAARKAEHDAPPARPASVCDEDVAAASAVLACGSIAACAKALASQRTTSVALAVAAAARCATVGHALNAVTHELFARAYADAACSDARRAAGGALGPLDGVPCSVKDVFEVAGSDTTAGLACRAFVSAARDGLITALLRDAGAVIVAKGNVPQALMVPESDNAIFGRTLSPWSAARTPGGSSGGDGALVASHCVAWGLGSDIGGSIRIPAAFTGTCGFKGTPERFTRRGMPAPLQGGRDGQGVILPLCGPIGRCVDDCLTVVRDALLVERARDGDATLPPLPWSARAWDAASGLRAGKRLRFAVWADGDGFFELAPPCVRVVHDAAAALRAAGHEVVAWSPRADDGLDLRAAALLYYSLMGADGGLRTMREGLEGEALNPLYSLLATLAALPDTLVRTPLAALLRAVGATRLGDLIDVARTRAAGEYWRLAARRDALRNEWVDAWRARGFHALIAPGMGVPALRHGDSRELNVACSYTFLFNTLGAPAGAVPVDTVGQDECEYVAPRGQRDSIAAVATASLAGAAGLPVGVQVVALPYEDELCLAAMGALEDALRDARAASGLAPREAGCPKAVLEATLRGLA